MADTSNILFPRKLVQSLIFQYRDSPCLWDRKHPHYKIKMKRHQAVNKLTQLVQEYDPSATRVHVLRKIDSLRACVRREHKRVVESRRCAANQEEVYTPSLWYYDAFSFIVEDDTHAHGIESKKELITGNSTEEESDGGEVSGHQEPFPEEYSPEYAAVLPEESEVPVKRLRSTPALVGDEYDAIGINVAAKLRNLQPSMKIVAEKLINDVLYQAQVNGLTPATAIVTPDPFKQDS